MNKNGAALVIIVIAIIAFVLREAARPRRFPRSTSSPAKGGRSWAFRAMRTASPT